MSKNKAPNTARPPFDPNYARKGEYREGAAPAVRPKDAATLILVRRDAKHPRVLMGQRHASHKFMPNKFVFPGGRVDPADSRVLPPDTLRAPVEKRLLNRMRGPATPARARALAMAAIRETFEEAGLVIGRRVAEPPRTKNPDWQRFYDEGVVPALSKLDFIARAITPPYRTRRFDTRFFLADAEQIQGDLHDTGRASGELLGLHWLTLDEARDLELPNITRMILDELDERFAQSRAAQARRPVPFVHFRRGSPIRDTL